MTVPLLSADLPPSTLARAAINVLLGGEVGVEITVMTLAGRSTRGIGSVLGVSAMTVSKRARVNRERLERVARLAQRLQRAGHAGHGGGPADRERVPPGGVGDAVNRPADSRLTLSAQNLTDTQP